jgi:acetyl-CoA C-acetyltransferase
MLMPEIPANGEPRTGLSMGQHCELMAKDWKIPREQQDQLAFESHRKAAAAYDEGFFDDLVIEFAGVKRDNNLRADTTLEKLATLQPAFDRKSDNGTLTGVNSTTLTNGASAVLLASEAWAKAHGFKPLAYLTFCETAAVDFDGGKEGSLRNPRGLRCAGAMHARRLGRPQVLQGARGLDQRLGKIDRSKLNIKGSSIALGHPFAATLAKIIDQNGGDLSRPGIRAAESSFLS